MTRLDVVAAAALGRAPDIARLLAALDGAGEETRIVGGAVRNALLGRPVNDIDLATTARPSEVIRRARAAGFGTVPTGIEHGTVTVLVGGRSFEVTTLREDVETDGRHAVVRFGRDFTADALRRDFTVNALSLARDGTIHDVTGGVADLEAGRLRFIGNPRQRIREDYLRILRFFRFTAEYAEGAPDRDGLEAAVAEREGLDTLSRERVRVELLKLLPAPRGPELVEILAACGLLQRLVGGVANAGRLRRVAERGVTDPVTRLAAALVTTIEDADRLRDRLRLSNAEHDRLTAYASFLARLASLRVADRPDIRRAVVSFGLPALCDWWMAASGEPRPALTDEGALQLSAFATEREPVPVFPLSGAALVEQGIAPGPEIGRRLAAARRDWLAAGCPPEIPVAP